MTRTVAPWIGQILDEIADIRAFSKASELEPGNTDGGPANQAKNALGSHSSLRVVNEHLTGLAFQLDVNAAWPTRSRL
ncbi:hypothetical protein HNQ27_17990 [Pseudomonas sp. B11D7D]|nr:hypothetical protein [Pseudomonas sp. B11D7D]QNH04566.1 hypothetical protein HNQ27_17990 [Pseudomonas sp. B11D7D]